MPSKSIIPRVCAKCGGAFLARPDQVARGDARFCSKSCAGRAQARPVMVICRWCEGSFGMQPQWLRRGRGHFCCRACDYAWRAANRVPMEERFLAMVQRGAPEDCWPWLGARTENGYGKFSQGRNTHHYAHRLIWQLEVGPIPPGMVIAHACDHPPCCNPAHLWLATQAENLEDMRRKGRRPSLERHGSPGERNPNARLTDAKVRSIRAQFAAGATQAALSQAFGMGETTVGHIVHGRTWGHLL